MLKLKDLAHYLSLRFRESSPDEHFLPEECLLVAIGFASAVEWIALRKSMEFRTKPITTIELDVAREDIDQRIADTAGLSLESSKLAVEYIENWLGGEIGSSGTGTIEVQGIGTIRIEGDNYKITLPYLLPPTHKVMSPAPRFS
jgi:hypothetical protein